MIGHGGKRDGSGRKPVVPTLKTVATKLSPEQVAWLGSNPSAALRRLVDEAMAREAGAAPGVPVARPRAVGGLCDRCRRLNLPGCQNCPKNRS